MKKICFFTPSLNIGGVEKVFLTYSEGLIKLGYDVSYVTTHLKGDLLKDLPISLNAVFLNSGKLRRSLIPLAKYLKQNTPDVLITGGDLPNAILILIVKFFNIKTKLIISQHNYKNVERNHFISKNLIKYVYKYSDYILSVSNGIEEMLISYGVKKNKIKTIYNPININRIKSSGEKKIRLDLPKRYLVFVGRLGAVKNLNLLIEAFHKIYKLDTNLHLVIVGDGPERSNVLSKIEGLGISENVIMLGALSNPYQIIKKSTLVLLSSFSEALPTVVLESFIFGKTVVSTPTNGAVDLLEKGRYGYLSQSFEVNDFYEEINKAIMNPIEEKKLFKHANNFKIDKKLKELISLF